MLFFFAMPLIVIGVFVAHKQIIAMITQQSHPAHYTRPKPDARLPFASAAIAGVAFIFFMSFTIVKTNEVGVGRSFGAVYESAYEAGFRLKAPWSKVQKHEILRQEFSFEGMVTSADNNPLTMNVGFATSLNPKLAWRIEQTVGSNYINSLVIPAGSTAVRIGLSRFGWVDATTKSREKVVLAIEDEYRKVLSQQLRVAGLTEAESKLAITVFPVQLRAVLPDGKVLNSIAEKSASEQDRERQNILTDIAEIEANRREQEGKGVTKLFNELPPGFTPEQIATVLSALATKTRADAMLKAVEGGKIGNLIINGDSQPGPVVSLQR